MKKIIIVLLVVFLASCSVSYYSPDQFEHDFDLKNLGYNKLYYSPDFDELTDYYKIAWYIYYNIKYVHDSTNTDPETILRTREANCNGFSVLFANIAYYSMGIQMNIASVDTAYESRLIVDGGNTNHSICYYGGTLVDPQQYWEPLVFYSEIGYLYEFGAFLY